MRHVQRVVISCLCTALLAGCTPPLDTAVPEVGPVRVGSGGPGSGRIEFVTSTNCVGAGEVVTFTVTLANETTEPFTITSMPLLDIVLEPSNADVPEPRPVVRWSETDQYPSNLSPVWLAGESRTYQWRWTADPAFDPATVKGNVVRATALFGDIQEANGGMIPAGEINFNFGIESLPISPSGGEISCAELPRASSAP